MLITIKRTLAVDVLTAAKQRIRNIFANGLPVYLSFSGGKDSLVLADITAKLVHLPLRRGHREGMARQVPADGGAVQLVLP
jgi:predicted phosphoadenosine phosphosulfate sulfurtransferase